MTPANDAVVVEKDAACLTRDGTALRGDIYRPAEASGLLPVLMTRTPYDRTLPLSVDVCQALARRGYIAVAQDVRGTHASEGVYSWIWNPEHRRRQGEDGYDAVEWAARLPGADGRVGTFGVSYMSHCSWALAIERPPSLKGMHVGGMSYTSLDMNFGIFDLGRRMQWIYAQAADQRRRASRTDGPVTRQQADNEWLNQLQGKWLWYLPLSTVPEYVFAGLTEDYRRFLEMQNQDVLGYGEVHAGLDIPVCTATGWWDRLVGCVRHYELLHERNSAALASKHRLIIGPWSHSPSTARRDIGPRDYGEYANYPYADQVADWYDKIFKGRCASRLDPDAPVRIFILNENQWRGFDSWPPREASMTPFYLHSSGRANSARGDGTLDRQPPSREPADRYVYDPTDPFMSLMGRDSHGLPADQGAADYRCDNLVFQSATLQADLVVVGYPSVTFWASSDRPDTDFVVKLIEVGADGLAINISQAIVRARYRKGYDREVMLKPGQPTRFDLRLHPVGIRFRSGSRIRVDIASSDFPNFDRNHNTGGRDWEESELLKAQQAIFHDAERPSCIVLPVLPA